MTEKQGGWWNWRTKVLASARERSSTPRVMAALSMESLEERQVLAANLITNGSFEDPAVSHGSKWDIYATIPGWTLESGPAFEIQRGLYRGAADGLQHLELDADQNGHVGANPANEQGSTRIAQSIDSELNAFYVLRFAFAARPDRSSANENKLHVQVEDSGGTIFVNETLSASDAHWRYYTYVFQGTGGGIKISFADVGINNTYGTFLDDVSVVKASVVNSTADGGDSNLNDGVAFTGNMLPDGTPEVTLRAAIQQANHNAGRDAIVFDIPTNDPGHANGKWTISPQSLLPTITDSVSILGDQGAAAGGAGAMQLFAGPAPDPIIILDGALAHALKSTVGGNDFIALKYHGFGKGLELGWSTGQNRVEKSLFDGVNLNMGITSSGKATGTFLGNKSIATETFADLALTLQREASFYFSDNNVDAAFGYKFNGTGGGNFSLIGEDLSLVDSTSIKAQFNWDAYGNLVVRDSVLGGDLSADISLTGHGTQRWDGVDYENTNSLAFQGRFDWDGSSEFHGGSFSGGTAYVVEALGSGTTKWFNGNFSTVETAFDVSARGTSWLQTDNIDLKTAQMKVDIENNAKLHLKTTKGQSENAAAQISIDADTGAQSEIVIDGSDFDARAAIKLLGKAGGLIRFVNNEFVVEDFAAKVDVEFVVGARGEFENNKTTGGKTAWSLDFKGSGDVRLFKNNYDEADDFALRLSDQFANTQINWRVEENIFSKNGTGAAYFVQGDFLSQGNNFAKSLQFGAEFDYVTTRANQKLQIFGDIYDESGEDNARVKIHASHNMTFDMSDVTFSRAKKSGLSIEADVSVNTLIGGNFEDITATSNLEFGLRAVRKTASGQIRIGLEGVFDENGYDGVYLRGVFSPNSILDSSFQNNGGAGIWISGDSDVRVANSTIAGNGIGIGAEDDALILIENNQIEGNDGAGVLVQGAASGTIQSNSIAGNGGAGVWLQSSGIAQATSNTFSANAGLDIDLGSAGPNANDPGDGDSGPNQLQNYAEIQSVVVSPTELTIDCVVPTATANATYPLIVEFYRVDGVTGEKTWIGNGTISAVDAELTVTLVIPLSSTVAGGDGLSCIVRDADGHTSEFSPIFVI